MLNSSEFVRSGCWNGADERLLNGLSLPVENDGYRRAGFCQGIHEKALTSQGTKRDHILLTVIAVNGATDARRKQRNRWFGVDLMSVRTVMDGNRHHLA